VLKRVVMRTSSRLAPLEVEAELFDNHQGEFALLVNIEVLMYRCIAGAVLHIADRGDQFHQLRFMGIKDPFDLRGRHAAFERVK
jgi:hypothetical protein